MQCADTIVLGQGPGAELIASTLVNRGEQVLRLGAEPSTQKPGARRRRAKRKVGPEPSVALRPRKEDLDDWADRGLPDWSWSACFPELRALESDLDFDGPAHGQHGPVRIRRYRDEELSPWQAAFLRACTELGFERCLDLNAPGALGHGQLPLSEPLEPSPRTQTLHRALPRRLLLRNRRIEGLEVGHGGSVSVLRSPRVVLCGGAASTLGLLLRSGIGPTEELSRLGVTPAQVMAGVGSQLLAQQEVEIGLLPYPGVCSQEDPRFQTGLRMNTAGGRRRAAVWLQPGSWLRLAGQPMELLSLRVLVAKPRQKHRIRLRDANPRRLPSIDSERRVPDPDDIEQAAEALQVAWLSASSGPMRELAQPCLPSERVLGSRKRLRRFIRAHFRLCPELAGTARMGPDEDPLAVTDAQGRVRGLSGLWIADASLMPSTPASDLHLTTLLIAQRLAGWLSES